MSKQKMVFLTGAGISQESGISTFRGSDGLWENHRIEDVASPEGFERNPELVLHFYNLRRAQLFQVKPNKAHKIIHELEAEYNVCIITQNVDDLHERAGSSEVIHLHGELRKVRSTGNKNYIVSWEGDLKNTDRCPQGHLLRPHIVWFGEAVPLIETAAEIVSEADYVIIVGTSLQVYPAASLMHYAKNDAKLFYIDPFPSANISEDVNVIPEIASKGMQILQKQLIPN